MEEAKWIRGEKVEVPGVSVEKVRSHSEVTVQVRESPVTISDKQAAFAVWLSEPVDARVPATYAAMADTLGVTETTLWRWSKRPDVQMAVRYLILQNKIQPDRVSTILDMYYEVAADAELPAKVRLAAGEKYLDAIGLKYVWNAGEGPELLSKQSNGYDVENMSTEELKALQEARQGD